MPPAERILFLSLTESDIHSSQSRPPRPTDQPRLNERIRVARVRVVGVEGAILGEMDTAQALALARESELDLVEVAPDARPPVCRIMDYGKVRYQRQKRSSGGRSHRPQLKQLRLRAKTGQHDLDVKVQRARQFLARGDKVKLNVMFRGRENAHHNRGRLLLEQVLQSLDDVALVEQSPRMESGRMMSALVKPRTTPKPSIQGPAASPS